MILGLFWAILETGNRGPAEPEPANSDKSYMRACVKLPAGAGAGANPYIYIACEAAAEPGGNLLFRSAANFYLCTCENSSALPADQRSRGPNSINYIWRTISRRIISSGPHKASPERLSVSTQHFLAKSEQIPTVKTKCL